MKNLHDFNAGMLNHFIVRTISDKVAFTEITNWHDRTPYYRLNIYDGVPISQVSGIYFLFNKDFLNQFDNIIEIGTYNGGLSSYLFDTKREDAFFISYDIDPNINLIKSRRPEINFRIGDCFETECFNEIADNIKRTGKTLMICDGGFKEREFNEFSEYLKKGDVIILHDYKHDEKLFDEASQYWQWPYFAESRYEAIKDAIEKNNLEPFNDKVSNFYFWGSYIKK